MSLKPQTIGPVPELTAFVAKAAFPDGTTHTRLRDELGTLYEDRDFAGLLPDRGPPALAPWRLAMVMLMQFLEDLSDRQAADAVRSRIDWEYALGLELTDPGFDFSALSVNQLATLAPDWTRGVARPEWFERYGRRVEDSRLPKEKADREAYARAVGEDGFALLDALEADQAAAPLRAIAAVQVLRTAWARHYERAGGQVRWKADAELPRAAEGIESPYDPEARYRTKRDTHWTGYMVHLTETCDEGDVHLISHVVTTDAAVHEVRSTAAIHRALAEKGLAPGDHLVDAAYVEAELLVGSQQEHGIRLIGPPWPDPSWQTKVEGAYEASRFAVDWEAERATCPEGKVSSSWTPQVDASGSASISVKFRIEDCRDCAARALCTRAVLRMPRALKLHPRAEHEALRESRAYLATEEGKSVYRRRAGVEGTLSQGVRAFGLRRARYIGLAKAHLQHVITGAATNLSRLAAWLEGIPQEPTRTSRFARLRPAG